MRREQDVAAYFDAVASSYSSRYGDSGPGGYALDIRWKHILNNLGTPKRLLDAGCGPGVFLRYCREQGIDAVGVDISSGMAAQAGGASVGALTDLPFATGAFDTVIAMGAVEYVGDDEQALCELVRVLQPGGRLLVTFPNRFSLFRLWRNYLFYPLVDLLRPTVFALKGQPPPPPVTQHHHAYMSSNLESLMQFFGCRIERIMFYNTQVVLSPIDELVPELSVSLSRTLEGRLPLWSNTAFLLVAQKDVI